MSFILQSSCYLCRYLVFEGKAADSVTSVELYQVKTVGVARDPDAGTKLRFEYVAEFEPQTCALCNLSFSIVNLLPSRLVFFVHIQVYFVLQFGRPLCERFLS